MTSFDDYKIYRQIQYLFFPIILYINMVIRKRCDLKIREFPPKIANPLPLPSLSTESNYQN